MNLIMALDYGRLHCAYRDMMDPQCIPEHTVPVQCQRAFCGSFVNGNGPKELLVCKKDSNCH